MGLCKRPLDAEAGVSVGLVYSTSRKSPELLKAFELCLREIASEMSLSPWHRVGARMQTFWEVRSDPPSSRPVIQSRS